MYLHCLFSYRAIQIDIQIRHLFHHSCLIPSHASTTMLPELQGGGGLRAGQQRCRPSEQQSEDQQDGHERHPRDQHERRKGRC
jgi:hypothetical protein